MNEFCWVIKKDINAKNVKLVILTCTLTLIDINDQKGVTINIKFLIFRS